LGQTVAPFGLTFFFLVLLLFWGPGLETFGGDQSPPKGLGLGTLSRGALYQKIIRPQCGYLTWRNLPLGAIFFLNFRVKAQLVDQPGAGDWPRTLHVKRPFCFG